jgi:glycosyltransferase involved in cell wall biosynthesis
MEYKNPSQANKTLVSVIIPGYNEEAIVFENLTAIIKYINEFQNEYDWEIIFVNDGSSDKTGILADNFAIEHKIVKVFHHIINLNLGNALKTGFAHAMGQYTITLDLDLSYAPDHIGLLLNTLRNTKADVVIASPYMKGGKVTAVPFIRRILSRWVNRFMRLAAQEKLHTYTGMVRAYRTEFLKNLNLKSNDYEICPEILYKSMILRARIVEIPAHLDWTEQNKLGAKRKSGIRLVKTFFTGLMAAFIFRPYIFFLAFGIILFLISLYLIGWIFYFTLSAIPAIPIDPQAFDDRFSLAIKQIYQQRPHLFFVGGVTLLAALQILSLGFLSLQSKRYFEELFHISTSVFKQKSKPENKQDY